MDQNAANNFELPGRTRRDNGLSRDPRTLATWAQPALYGDNLPPLLGETCRKTIEIRRNPPTEPVRRWLVLGPCDKSVGGGQEGLSNVSFSDKHKGADGRETGWTQTAATTEGLASVVPAPKGIADAHAFCAVAFDSPRAQALEVGLGASTRYVAWLNGKLAFSRSSPLALKKNNALHVLPLKPGRNVLVIRINTGKSRASLILTYRGDGVKVVVPE